LGNGRLANRGELRGAVAAEPRGVGVIGLAFRALDGHGRTLFSDLAKGLSRNAWASQLKSDLSPCGHGVDNYAQNRSAKIIQTGAE
jgi:hypothetical protein